MASVGPAGRSRGRGTDANRRGTEGAQARDPRQGRCLPRRSVRRYSTSVPNLELSARLFASAMSSDPQTAEPPVKRARPRAAESVGSIGVALHDAIFRWEPRRRRPRAVHSSSGCPAHLLGRGDLDEPSGIGDLDLLPRCRRSTEERGDPASAEFYAHRFLMAREPFSRRARPYLDRLEIAGVVHHAMAFLYGICAPNMLRRRIRGIRRILRARRPSGARR